MAKYNFASVQISIGGKVLGTARRYETSEKTDSEDYHVLGASDPAAILQGNTMYNGSITLSLEEASTFVRSLPTGVSPTKAVLNIVAVFVADGQPTYTEKVTDVRFTEWNLSVEQGQKFIDITVPFKFRKIERA